MIKNSKIIALVVTCITISATPVLAEITSSPCPYSCRTQGIPKKVCKDWKEADRCFIDDLRHRPGVLSNAEQERRNQIEQDKQREAEKAREKEKAREREKAREKEDEHRRHHDDWDRERDYHHDRDYDDRHRHHRDYDDDRW